MDFARLARVRWRGALPERSSVDGGSQGASASAVSGAPNAQSDATRGADGTPAAAATSTARSQAGPTQSRLRDPAFRCVWVRGQTHGLQLQSDAERVSSVELEADALYGDIVNVHDVSHEPLQSARDDLRLVASLNQIWQDENARRASKGLPKLDEDASTPRSAVAARNAPPPQSNNVLHQLRSIDDALARPPPAPPPMVPDAESGDAQLECEADQDDGGRGSSGEQVPSIERGSVSQLLPDVGHDELGGADSQLSAGEASLRHCLTPTETRRPFRFVRAVPLGQTRTCISPVE